MKYITEHELMEKMEYSSMNSFKNSKTNYKLLHQLVDFIESRVIKDYEDRIETMKLHLREDFRDIMNNY